MFVTTVRSTWQFNVQGLCSGYNLLGVCYTSSSCGLVCYSSSLSFGCFKERFGQQFGYKE